jgi:beta-lactamase class A
MDELLKPLIDEFSGQVSMAYYNFRTQQDYFLHADKQQWSASLIKIPILTCALHYQLPLYQRHRLTEEDMASGTGVLQHLSAGLEPTLYDLLTLMIIQSDNLATNKVIDLLGQDNINHYLKELHLHETRVVGKLQLPAHQQNPEQRKGLRNQTSARDMLKLLVGLEKRQLLPEKETRIALDILEKQQFTEAMSRYLPRDPELSENYVIVASKSGCLRGLWHDAGVVYTKDREPLYALVVMTEGSADESYSFEQEGMMLIARISKAVFMNSPSKFH